MMENQVVSEILKILIKYEDDLTDGYAYYFHRYMSIKSMLTTIATDIIQSISVNQDKPNSAKANIISCILQNYEDDMSDGFGYYYHNYPSVEDLLRKISIEIIEVIDSHATKKKIE